MYISNNGISIRDILMNQKTIAVVGLSPKENRTSHWVSKYLQQKGYKIIPVYPTEDEILGEKVYRSLSEIPEKVDTVLIFRRSEFVRPIVEAAIKIHPKTIWMQDGIADMEAAKLAEENGITVVMDNCMYREHKFRMND
ncbi:MAG: CoA-binding protein [Calditrichia bacterium]